MSPPRAVDSNGYPLPGTHPAPAPDIARGDWTVEETRPAVTARTRTAVTVALVLTLLGPIALVAVRALGT